LIVSRLLRFALASSLGRAWRLKSKKWLTLAVALALFRMFERCTVRRNNRAARKRQA
jgi:hypothetical protein